MVRLAFLLVLVVAAAGCSGRSRTSAVTGVVLLGGKPLAGASIQMIPETPGQGRDATGETNASGEFTMSTFAPRDGMVPGTYKVVISPAAGAVDTATYASAEDAMHAASKPAAKKAAGPPFPEKFSRPDLTPLIQKVPAEGPIKIELPTS